MNSFATIAQRTDTVDLAVLVAPSPFEHGRWRASMGWSPMPSLWYRKLSEQLAYMAGYLADELVLSDENFRQAEAIYDSLLAIAEMPDCEPCTDWRI